MAKRRRRRFIPFFDRTIRVTYICNSRARYGYFDPVKYVITINTYEQNEYEIRRTLTHELIHAIESHFGFEIKDWEQVNRMSQGLVELFYNTPDILRRCI